MSKVSGPDFLAIQVRDLEKSSSFYEKQLGLKRREDSPPGVIAYDTTPIPFAIREPQPGTDLEAGPVGLGVSLSLKADNAIDLCKNLRENGITILVQPFDTPFGKTFVFSDPDGYAIAIHEG
ncbi:MAG: VOC family protein [Candidatus Saccharimonadales bacterium]